MPRLIPAPLNMCFSEFHEEKEILREYDILSETEEDPVGQWLKLAKARGETSDSDQVLLTLMVELHRKLDNLNAYIRDEKIERLTLEHEINIDSIGFDNFQAEGLPFVSGNVYYGRILMPIFPKREVPIFFTAVSGNLARIDRLHKQDRTDWNAYITARERIMIREMRTKKDGN